MDKKTIGILGATGYVGRGAVRAMLAFTEYRILIGCRNEERVRHLFPKMEQKIGCLQVDVHNRDQLHRFCGKCDIVVNCAGPSKQIADTVAAACIEQGVHYVDVSGDEHLYEQLMKRKQEIEEKELSIVISAGVYPGLSEIFPAYVAETYFDDIDALELFFAGQGGFSLNAAYDIVCSIEEDTGLGMTYCKHGEAQKMDGPFHRNYSLPFPAGKRDTYPVLNREFQQMARQNKMKSAYFYNTYPNHSVLNQFVMIKALEQYKTEEQKRASAKALTEQFEANNKEANAFTMFHLIASGSKHGKPLKLVANLLSQNDWNTLSGILAAHAAKSIMEEDEKKSGCFFVAEAVQAAKLIGELSERHIVIEHTFTEFKQG